MASQPPFPVPRSPRYESLDLWRGVACLMIVLTHSQAYKFATLSSEATRSARPLAREIGWHGVALNKAMGFTDLGVPIFFVISGYCIAASCDSGRRKSQGFRSFYVRRFRRIFPPYWIYLGIVSLLFAGLAIFGLPDSLLNVTGVILEPPWKMAPSSVVGSVLLTSTWQDRLVDPGGMISAQAWSLCYEEQFYLIAGLVLWLSPRRLYAGIAAVSAAVLALYLASSALGLDLHGCFFDGFWLLFGAGFLAFYRINHCSGRSIVVADATLAVGAVVLFLTRNYTATRWFSPICLPVGFAFALLLCWLHRWDLRVASSRVAKPFTFCGRMCYSLYLIHYPIVAFASQQAYRSGIRGFWPTMLVTIPVTVALSIVASYAFCVIVERRFLNPSPLAPPRPESPAIATA